MLVELSVVEQRYQAVLAVISGGEHVVDVARAYGVSRQTVHAWLRRYEDQGLAGLVERSHRPRGCPHQMPPAVEAQIAEWRRHHPHWGPRRMVHELGKAGFDPVPSRSGVYRALVRLGLIDPQARRRRGEHWRRWERAEPMELWQLDVVGGVATVDGRTFKALTGVDDHSRFCVLATLMTRETSRSVCSAFAAAMRAHGVPQEVLTDNGKVFTGRFAARPVEVLFDRICRENGITHRLTEPRSPTTTGKIERFHRSLRAEFLTGRVFASVAAAQAELDAWVREYNTVRPHQGLQMATPAERFYRRAAQAGPQELVLDDSALRVDRTGEAWVARTVTSNGTISVSWQQFSVGRHRAGHRVDVHVTQDLLQVWDGPELIKTLVRTSRGEVRKKRAARG
jgi:transposase InsO family protein